MVEGWDWNRFKPLSVARVHDQGEGVLYEVVDGQHTAIAAMTHGAIELLPCLVLEAPSVADRAADFVGINRGRTGLTPYALFRAGQAARDPIALDIRAALEATGVTLVESVRTAKAHVPGMLSCPSTLRRIVREKGRARLERCLVACVAAGLAPIDSATLKMLHGAAAISSDAQLATLARQCA